MNNYSQHLVSRLLIELDAIDLLNSRIREKGGIMSDNDDDAMNALRTNVMELRNALGKEAQELAHVNMYSDSDSMGVGEFKTIELFPRINDAPSSYCTECGAYVKIQQQVLHTHWHNKVADL